MSEPAFYSMNDGSIPGAIVAELADNVDPAPLLRGDGRLPRNVQARVFMGRRPVDLAIGGHVAALFLSRRAVAAFEDAGITGWTTYPVAVAGLDGARLEYFGLSVLGRCGPIDKSRSRVVTRPPRVPNAPPYRAWMGLYFDSNTWDGSDFFMARDETLFVFATERVRDTVRRNNLTNFDFTPIDEVERLVP